MHLSFDILNKNKELLNKINVFPVADGDTGKNLYNTVKDLEKISSNNLKSFLEEASNITMINGTGSSGNILALFTIGLFQNYNENLSIMCKSAAQFAWNTMFEPVEGTILTAMKDVPEEYSSIEDFIYKYIQNTYKNLMEGPDLLLTLKESETLDSGTLGFLYVLCDIYKSLTSIDISPNIDLLEPTVFVTKDTNNRYCVEISLISDRQELKQTLSKEGSELVYLSSGDKIKLHIHTNNYIRVFDLCKEFGQIIDYKIEDMLNANERLFL